MSAQNRSDIHRYLDEVFSDVVVTPDLQDLKEELRGNLMARAAELQASSATPAEAAERAIDELGDIRELVHEIHDGDRAAAHTSGSAAHGSPSPGAAWIQAQHVNRVRPKPGFVVGIVVAALAAVVAIVLAALSALDVLSLPAGPVIAFAGIAASGIAWIVGDSLAHETTTNHPMPQMRASGYFLATLLGAYGLAFGGLVALDALPAWCVVFAALGVVGAIVLFAFLGATQTNRKKAWVRAAQREYAAADRFSEDPAAAARFGIYTVVIWLLAFAAFVVLSFTVGFVWSWIALLAGFVIFFIVLARMLFPADGSSGSASGGTGGTSDREDHHNA